MTALSLSFIWAVGLMLGPDPNWMLVAIPCGDISQVEGGSCPCPAAVRMLWGLAWSWARQCPPGAWGLPTLGGLGAGLGSAPFPLLPAPPCADSGRGRVRMLRGFGDVDGCMFQTPWGSPELQRRDDNLTGTLLVNKHNHILLEPMGRASKDPKESPPEQGNHIFPV